METYSYNIPQSGHEPTFDRNTQGYRQFTPKATDLEQLEAEARQAEHGLWSDPRAVPPWEWRKSASGE
jgi:endonuclease YncB( thermonuclease family)